MQGQVITDHSLTYLVVRVPLDLAHDPSRLPQDLSMPFCLLSQLFSCWLTAPAIWSARFLTLIFGRPCRCRILSMKGVKC